MSRDGGQAAAEYAGLLALAALLGAGLALIAGPPLVRSLRAALVASLSGSGSQAIATATAADIADVQSALIASDAVTTPDAALLAVRRRHGDDAGAMVDGLVLAAARAAVPWLAAARTYDPWPRRRANPFAPVADVAGDHDVETPVGPAAVIWVNGGTQRDGLAKLLDKRGGLATIGLDLISVAPPARWGRAATMLGAGARTTRVARRGPKGLAAVTGALDAVTLYNVADGGVPAGLRPGDVVISWPVHRTAWRDDRRVEALEFLPGKASQAVPMPADYTHGVILRAGPSGLAVISETAGP